jgi:superoxide oxidase
MNKRTHNSTSSDTTTGMTVNGMTNTSFDRYSTLSITLHWVMVVLLVAIYTFINLADVFPKGSEARSLMKTWHFMLGLSVLALVLLRIAVNISKTAPAILPTPPKWQMLSAKGMHLALYVLMVCMPIVGWLLLSASGKPIPFFGLQLPALISANKELSVTLREIHDAGGTMGYLLIGLHAAAGLFHHYFAKDNTLLRILPK